jgi:ASC-1-like (ASCH) protein
MPLFKTKREVFNWIKSGQKTIDIRKGEAWKGETAVIQCGLDILRMIIIKKETGNLSEIITEDNYKAIIPTANSLEEAIKYLQKLYGNLEGIFSAYYLQPIINSNCK